MGGCVDKLPVGGDEVDDVAHDAEQRHHEHGIHAGDDLRAEQGHDHPHARDAGEQRPASRIALPSEGEQNGVAELHRAHGQHAHNHEDPDEGARRRTLLPEDVVAGHHVVGKSLAIADLAYQIREKEGQDEGDGHGDAAHLAAGVEGDDATRP